MSFSITNSIYADLNAIADNLLNASNHVASAYGHEVVKIGETAGSKSFWYTAIKIIVLALIAVSLIAFIYLSRKGNQGSAASSPNIHSPAPAQMKASSASDQKAIRMPTNHDVPNSLPHLNATYTSRIPDEGMYQDPIFTLLSDVNVREFDSAIERWSQLE